MPRSASRAAQKSAHIVPRQDVSRQAARRGTPRAPCGRRIVSAVERERDPLAVDGIDEAPRLPDQQASIEVVPPCPAVAPDGPPAVRFDLHRDPLDQAQVMDQTAAETSHRSRTASRSPRHQRRLDHPHADVAEPRLDGEDPAVPRKEPLVEEHQRVIEREPVGVRADRGQRVARVVHAQPRGHVRRDRGGPSARRASLRAPGAACPRVSPATTTPPPVTSNPETR